MSKLVSDFSKLWDDERDASLIIPANKAFKSIPKLLSDQSRDAKINIINLLKNFRALCSICLHTNTRNEQEITFYHNAFNCQGLSFEFNKLSTTPSVNPLPPSLFGRTIPIPETPNFNKLNEIYDPIDEAVLLTAFDFNEPPQQTPPFCTSRATILIPSLTSALQNRSDNSIKGVAQPIARKTCQIIAERNPGYFFDSEKSEHQFQVYCRNLLGCFLQPVIPTLSNHTNLKNNRTKLKSNSPLTRWAKY